MAGWIDQLMQQGGGWMPQAAAPMPYVEGMEFADPELAKKKKKPFEDVPLPPKPISQMERQAGILEPGVTGSGPEARAYRPDPFMPGNDRSPFMSAPERQMQSLTSPDIEQTAERVPTPRERPQEASGESVASTGGSGARSLGAQAPEVREADGAKLPAPPSTDLSSSNRGQSGADGAPEGQQPNIFGSLIPRIGNFLKNNSNTLLALGAGFGGAPNVWQGLGRAAQNAIPASQLDIKNQTQQQQQSSLFQALRQAGVPPNQALAAVGNPKMAEALISSYITDPKFEVKSIKSKNAWGEESEKLVAINPRDPTDYKVIGEGGGRGAGGAAAGAAPGLGLGQKQSQFYAPGITDDNVDQTKVGDDYLAQFSPPVQQAAKDYLVGRTSQTGRQAPQQRIKMIAQKYGNDVNMPADDAAIAQRKTYSTSLGDTKSGVGAQVKGLQQGLEHFVKLSDALVKMNLSNGFGVESAANFANWMKSLTTEQQDIIHKAQFEGQALAGEMGNLFSKNGGGVHERAKTSELVSNAFMSSKAAAGSLEGVVEMMDGGLKSLTQRRDELFPDQRDWPRGSNFFAPKQEAELNHIKQNIAKLRGTVPAEGAAAAAPAINWRVVQ